jgi:hypothetical protein
MSEPKSWDEVNGTAHMTQAAREPLHKWVPSTLGHGEAMCEHCLITNREAAALGWLNYCAEAARKSRATVPK